MKRATVSGRGLLSSADLYEPNRSAWMPTGAMEEARAYHTATMLANGLVLVTGGQGTDRALAIAELFDPVDEISTLVASMDVARQWHAATRLPNGSVLVSGGYDGTNALASSELYDPSVGRWTATGPMTVARFDHTATLLPDGRVLVAGGSYAVGAGFGVITSGDPTLPLSEWTPLGGIFEISPGTFRFTDRSATNGIPRFYRLRSL